MWLARATPMRMLLMDVKTSDSDVGARGSLQRASLRSAKGIRRKAALSAFVSRNIASVSRNTASIGVWSLDSWLGFWASSCETKTSRCVPGRLRRRPSLKFQYSKPGILLLMITLLGTRRAIYYRNILSFMAFRRVCCTFVLSEKRFEAFEGV